MSDPARFLVAFAQGVSQMTLYAEGHPARERALDAAYRELCDLLDHNPRIRFTFLGDEVLVGERRLRELHPWEWAERLTSIGIQRLEFDGAVSRSEFEGFLDEVLARLTLATIDTSEARPERRSSIRFGGVGMRGEMERESAALPTATIKGYSLGEEAETIRWLQEEVQGGGKVPLVEAEAIVRSLAVAMHSDQQVVMPLVQLKQFDEYTTTHSMNVAVLSMALAEFLGFGASDVRAFGVAGLLHDLGKIRVPREVLVKPGKLTEAERVLMKRHPADGARLILATEESLDLAAIVAYEHHIMLNGGGYPSLRYRRDCHSGSKLVHICDVYDALRTKRPYRDAWPIDQVTRYLQDRAGIEFDLDLTKSFCDMMQRWQPRAAVLSEDATPSSGADSESRTAG